MGLRITYKSYPYGATIEDIFVETDNGSAKITWTGGATVTHVDGSVTLSCYALRHKETDRTFMHKDIKNARVTDVIWRDKYGRKCGGKIEILSVAFIETNHGNALTMTGTPLSLPQSIDYESLDAGVRNIVKYFNDNGLRTVMSCDGCNGHGFGFLWVEFHKSVTEDDIRTFMCQHTEDAFGYTGNGWFVKRFMTEKSNGNVQNDSYLVYMAKDNISADMDIRQWNSYK